MLRDTKTQLAPAGGERPQLPASASDRLLARLETMPVIEQAKGILMAQTGCDADAALATLRQAAQRSNVPVSEVAAAIVQRTAAGHPAAGDSHPAPGPGAPTG